MTPASARDPIAALNEVLSEVVDVALAVRQARHAVPDGHELHAELDRLFTNARTWAQQLVDVDNALGDPALAHMPTPAARRPPTLG